MIPWDECQQVIRSERESKFYPYSVASAAHGRTATDPSTALRVESFQGLMDLAGPRVMLSDTPSKRSADGSQAGDRAFGSTCSPFEVITFDRHLAVAGLPRSAEECQGPHAP